VVSKNRNDQSEIRRLQQELAELAAVETNCREMQMEIHRVNAELERTRLDVAADKRRNEQILQAVVGKNRVDEAEIRRLNDLLEKLNRDAVTDERLNDQVRQTNETEICRINNELEQSRREAADQKSKDQRERWIESKSNENALRKLFELYGEISDASNDPCNIRQIKKAL
jgi:hypothetical protein